MIDVFSLSLSPPLIQLYKTLNIKCLDITKYISNIYFLSIYIG